MPGHIRKSTHSGFLYLITVYYCERFLKIQITDSELVHFQPFQLLNSKPAMKNKWHWLKTQIFLIAFWF